METERRGENAEGTGDQETVAQLQELVVLLKSERDALKTEVSRLNEKMKVEGEEWLQFQHDMHLAVTVADRLRLEAEAEIEGLRERLEEEEGKSRRLQEELDATRRKASDTMDGLRERDLPSLSVLKLPGNEANNGHHYQPHVRCHHWSEVTSFSESGAGKCRDPAETEERSRQERAPSDVSLAPRESDRNRLKMKPRQEAENTQTPPITDPHANRQSVKLKEPLADLVKRSGGSKRNTLLNWSKMKTAGYQNIDITNFSSSWSDGLALCALLHTYLPDQIPYQELHAQHQERNLTLAFNVLKSVGIEPLTDVDSAMRGTFHWQDVLSLVESLYNRFET
ncbi:cytospin-A [Cetorhinus maximus]